LNKSASLVQQSYPKKASFRALNAPIGTIVSLDLAAPARRSQVRLLGSEYGQGLIVSLPKPEFTALIQEGTLLKVRFLLKTGFVNFGARVLAIQDMPFPHMFLSFPSSVEIRNVRSAERISTSIHANVDSDFNIDGAWPKTGSIEDLSKTGAKLRSRERLGEFGHELKLEFKLKLSDMTRTVRLGAIIRNAHVESKAMGEPHFVFGVQFLELDDEARLALISFIYEPR